MKLGKENTCYTNADVVETRVAAIHRLYRHRDTKGHDIHCIVQWRRIVRSRYKSATGKRLPYTRILAKYLKILLYVFTNLDHSLLLCLCF